VKRASTPLAVAAVAWVAAWAALPTPAASQLPDTTRYASVATSPTPRGTVVSIVVRIPSGSADDQEGFGGTAWLLGHLLADRADEAAGPGTSVAVQVSRGETLFTVLSLPGGWVDAWSHVESVIFGEAPEAVDVDRGRQALQHDLTFDQGSPVRNFEMEAARIIAPTSHPWARPIRGTPQTLGNVSELSLRLFAGNYYQPHAATVSVVGPRSFVSPTPPRPAGGERPARLEPAWSVGQRFRLDQDITNSWIAVAWPVDPELPRTSLEFLVHLLAEQLDPAPPDPDRYSVDVRLEETPGGPVVVVEAAIFPEAADRWEARILDQAALLAREAMDDDFFGWRRRRFRTARLLTESRPEAKAARIAHDIARSGAARDLPMEIWDLESADLLGAARALGEPRILRLGPDLGSRAPTTLEYMTARKVDAPVWGYYLRALVFPGQTDGVFTHEEEEPRFRHGRLAGSRRLRDARSRGHR